MKGWELCLDSLNPSVMAGKQRGETQCSGPGPSDASNVLNEPPQKSLGTQLYGLADPDSDSP